MKVIDLLNKIANGEEVPKKKIKYNNETFTIREEKDDYVSEYYWFTDRYSLLDLNNEVEIIEEDKKIEKMERHIPQSESELYCIAYNGVVDKINQIIDHLNKEGNNNE